MTEFRVELTRKVTQTAQRTVIESCASNAGIIARHEANQDDSDLIWQTEEPKLPIKVTSKIVGESNHHN